VTNTIVRGKGLGAYDIPYPPHTAQPVFPVRLEFGRHTVTQLEPGNDMTGSEERTLHSSSHLYPDSMAYMRC
jgi:hypothetical protein